MPILTAAFAGVLFGAGLTVSQMVDPRKVLDFLDVGGIAHGTWDPTLLMVFAGALGAMFAAYAVQRRMARPLLAPAFAIPARTAIDARLIVGSGLFGVGWGLAGVCPGPALTALAIAGGTTGNVLLFVAAMIAGILLSRLIAPGAPARAQPATEPRT